MILSVSREYSQRSLRVLHWRSTFYTNIRIKGRMAFFASAVSVLQTLVIALGAGLGIWGVINLMEGYGNDNPGANAHVT